MPFRQFRPILWLGMGILCIIGIICGIFLWKSKPQGVNIQAPAPPIHVRDLQSESLHVTTPTPHSTPVKVMLIGGSVALGWDDQTGGGYLMRAFKEYSTTSKQNLDVVNASVEGDGPGLYASQYNDVLKRIHPNVLVISWGILDDISHKTSISTFGADMKTEISTALANHITVFIVTPPVTTASYTSYQTLEPAYLAEEIAVAKSFKSSNIHVFNLFTQMKQYLSSHHLAYNACMADNWHPNTAGHALAGELLGQDFNTELSGKL